VRKLCLSMILVIVITSLLLIGNVQAKEEISFTLFHHLGVEEGRGAIFRKLIEEYNQEHQGKVKINTSYFADWIPLQEKIRTMVAAGSPPDLFYYNFNPNDLALEKSGELMDFTPYMDEEWRYRFISPSILDMLTIDGKLMSIPFVQGTVVFYYNKKLFDKEFPGTWDEFFKVCDKLKESGITPVSLFTSDDAWHAMNFFTYFAASIGGPDVFQKPLDSPAIVEAARMLKKLFNYTTADAIGGKWAISVNNFIIEETAILVDGPWVIKMLDDGMEDPDQVIAAAAPTFKEGEPYCMLTDTVTPWAASNRLSNEQKEAVVDFLKWFDSEEVAKRFVIDGKNVSLVKVDLTKEEDERAGVKLASNIKLSSGAQDSVIQITRILKPAAMSEIPKLVEGLAIDRITAEEFAKTLQELNK